MRAAVLYEANTPLRIEEVSLDGPREDEVLDARERLGDEGLTSIAVERLPFVLEKSA